jgi:hypothetical protein
LHLIYVGRGGLHAALGTGLVAARGVVCALLGWLLVPAGWRRDPSEIRRMG